MKSVVLNNVNKHHSTTCLPFMYSLSFRGQSPRYGFQTTFATSFLHFFQFRKFGIQLFHALFAEVDGQSGGFAFIHGVDNHAGAEFGVADVLSDAEACVGLRLFVVVDDFVFGYGSWTRAAVAVVSWFFDGQVMQHFGWDFFDEAGEDGIYRTVLEWISI